MRIFLLILTLLFYSKMYPLLWGTEPSSYPAQVCQSMQKKDGTIIFPQDEVQKIVDKTGLDPRSICHFIQLGSHVYSLDVLREELLENKGELKIFLNQHYIFPEDIKFFQHLADFLFSNKISDSQQVLNSLILNDLLYGYEIGDTIPIYMEQFLYYAGNNKSKKEQDAMNQIMPYILYVEGTLLNKKDFTTENTGHYIKNIQKTAGQKVSSLAQKNKNRPAQNIIQDSAY